MVETCAFPLPPRSLLLQNYYVLDSGRWTPTPVQEARAAVVVFGMMQYLERLEDGDIPPVSESLPSLQPRRRPLGQPVAPLPPAQ